MTSRVVSLLAKGVTTSRDPLATLLPTRTTEPRARGIEIMRSRGGGPGEREQVETIRRDDPTRGRVRDGLRAHH